MTTRRLFLAGAAAAAVTGGGLAFDFPAVAQRRTPDPLTRELRRQLREAMAKINNGRGEGARQGASTLRLWAATLEGAGERQFDAAIRQAIRQKGRTFLLYAPANHAEMQKLAQEIGFPIHLLPPHEGPNPTRREQALRVILEEGLLPSVERAAQELEEKSEEMDRRGAAVRSISMLRACELPCDAAEAMGDAAQIYCAAMLIFPALVPACELASGSWLMLLGACYACRLVSCGTTAGC